MNQTDHLEPLLDALDALQHLLSRFDNRGVVIGGAAVSLLGKARFTEDVDAVLLLSNKDLPRLLEVAKEEGIEPRIDHAADFARKKSCSAFEAYTDRYQHRYFAWGFALRDRDG